MALVSTLGSVGVKVVAATLLGRTTWRTVQARDRSSETPFVAVLATLTLWAVCVLGDELPSMLPGEVLATACSVGQLGAALLLPGVWVVYALGYTGRGTGLTPWRIALFAGIVAPAVLGVVVAVTGSSERAVVRGLAPLIVFELLYLSGLFAYGTYLMVRFGGDHARVSNTQVLVVTSGVATPYLLSLVWDPASGVSGTSVGLLVAGGLLSVAVRRYPVTTGFPKADHVARTRVVETLEEAVVVLDRDDHVLDANETATELFGPSVDDAIGDPVRAVVDGLDRVELAPGSTGTVTLRTSRGRRRYQFSVSAVTDSTVPASNDDPVARTVLFRDVTDRRTRRQRLSVLNRILRHNVRNDLDAALAYVDLVDDDEVRAGIEDTLTETVRLARKARDAEEAMTAVTESPKSVDLATLARSVADRFREDYPGEITVDCADEPRVVSHPTVVRRVLSELVENALVHAGEAPTVEVTVRHGANGAAEVTVTDDGPGIPERERAVLGSDAETQLDHGRGIGLWFVNWAVTQLGGELEFGRNDHPGGAVTVRLYDTAASG